ncbi:MAG: hypothetical protein K5871_05805 [Lachnospiraceae bacterium]|nr:hypothetical protein [Lachnospiraceae bacterium]
MMLLTSYTETFVDENGVTHIHTYTDYSNGGRPPIDKSSLTLLILSVLVVLGLAAYHLYRAYKAIRIKKACIEQIPANVVMINSARADDRNYRYRYKRYSAVYRYEYKGRTYSNRNRMWGSKEYLGDLRQGMTAMINICPAQPEIMFDRLGESERKYFLSQGILQSIMGIAIVLMIIFRDRI